MTELFGNLIELLLAFQTGKERFSRFSKKAFELRYFRITISQLRKCLSVFLFDFEKSGKVPGILFWDFVSERDLASCGHSAKREFSGARMRFIVGLFQALHGDMGVDLRRG
jgi:hypothetical protein